MGALVMVLGGGCMIVALVCWVILLVAAFRDAVWKGIVGFFCGLYLLYFGFAEYDGENKVLITLGMLLGGILGRVLLMVGSSMMHS